MEAKKQLIGLPPYKPGKPIEEVKREFGLNEVIKLASNENPFGASKQAQEAIRHLATETAVYPDGYAAELRQKVSAFLNVEQEQLVFGNGSDEVIQMLCRTFLTSDTNTVTATPTFSQYKLNAVIEGAEIREVPLKDGVHDLQAMLRAIDQQTRIVWVCNPNNPSGTYVNEQEFRSFLEQVPDHVLVVSDEAYYEYVTAKDFPQTLPLVEEFENLLVLRTFSKAYGLAALRIGYGVAQRSVISLLDPVRPPFNTTTIAHASAIAALGDQAFINDCVERNNEGIKQYVDFCNKHELTYYPTQTNFILIDFNRSGDEVFDYLLRRGYIVRSGEALGFPTCVRITVGSKEQNQGIIEELTTWLEQTKVSN
ncbi:histidinol-phosphate transaminase [Desertibacillus haloalkaliphilus]|uniref:histidinol-phosphate transaminase n=1 Tax=Desertibacillus haloalkaliphilus TaxID=1328930 RepID=UPI001C260C64|nr:histidinol-phosphate transaminase [Desertibacillus haloalkaliphilus]MBU8907255.1 histidinol-phosphate transaminase [Desertibacillus haloalkaliphilus]